MKKIIIAIIIIILLAGGYVFVKDRQIKADLSKVEESQSINQDTASSTKKVVDSEITLTRTAGVWTVESTGDYTIDPKTLKFEFTGYKPGGQHVGTFNTMKVDIALDAEGQPIGSVMSMDVASIKTDTEALDKHLQTADFFDVAKNPLISVVVNSINKESETDAKAATSITMKGTTKSVSTPVKFTPVSNGVKFAIDTRINIADFQIAYGPVLNEVRVTTEGVLIKNK